MCRRYMAVAQFTTRFINAVLELGPNTRDTCKLRNHPFFPIDASHKTPRQKPRGLTVSLTTKGRNRVRPRALRPKQHALAKDDTAPAWRPAVSRCPGKTSWSGEGAGTDPRIRSARPTIHLDSLNDIRNMKDLVSCL